MLFKAGCNIPRPTLNRWIHEVIDGLYGLLMPEMEKAVKGSRFTHNDETRMLVRSQEKDETSPSYKTEYIHGILSPEANLFMMPYKDGSRAHTVQLDIFRDSNIIAFMYSLVESCRMNGLDFGLYIETVLRRILDGDTDIHGMMPNVITLPDRTQKNSAS